MTDVLAAIPYARFLGVSLDQTSGALECVLPFREEIVGNTVLRSIHGGVIGAFLELTAILRLINESPSDRVPRPINFAIDYLSSAGPMTTRARADIFKLGRRIAVVHVIAWQNDPTRPVASGNGKFLLPE
jgi:uncharacterized protein (TIGR00369 family)